MKHRLDPPLLTAVVIYIGTSQAWIEKSRKSKKKIRALATHIGRACINMGSSRH